MSDVEKEEELCILLIWIIKKWILKTPTGYEECKHQIVEYYQKDNIEYVE